MPQELLRDLFRAGDAPGRARRRWSVLPISIAVHAAVVAAVLIMPLAAEVGLPTPASPPLNIRPVEIRSMPSISPPSRRDAPRVNAPSVAPSEILPETKHAAVTGPPGDEVPGAIPGVGNLPPSLGDSASVGVPVLPPPPSPPQPSKPVPVGHGVREPKKIVDVRPVYPAFAQIAHIEGVVVLEAVIDERGVVDHVRVLKSVPLLDDAAIEAVRAWRYTPTLLNGVPVSVLMTITINFRLH